MNQVLDPQDFARFVPGCISRRLAEQGSEFKLDFSEPGLFSVLFADISGFTALSEKLASRGPEGVEELTQVLNSYFGEVIAIITAYGGDIVKFAGDAVLAFWAAESQEDLSRTTELASAAAMRVQDSLKTFGSTINHRLFLREGVGAGNAILASLGGIFNRHECVLIGDAVIEATMATAKAETGTVVLGATARDTLQDRCDSTEFEMGYHRLNQLEPRFAPEPMGKPNLPPGSESILKSFIPAAIHRRLAALQGDWLGELRRPTILFVNLPELNAHTPLERSNEVIRKLQAELYRHEGSVNKLSIDEKGVTLVAAFGLPPLAHEDDPSRGVLAALAMKQVLLNLGWKASIGITSGRVFCGSIGSRIRCEYTIIGDVVNLSARLMQAAKGKIYCDESTYKAARADADWEILEPIMVKGKTYPIPVFQPKVKVHTSTHELSEEGMVGRGNEKAFLDRTLHKLKDESVGGAIIVEGEAGIGKSTLVSNLVQQAKLLEITPWLGAAFPLERSTPFYIWRAILRRCFRLQSSDSHPDQRAAILKQIENDPELVGLIPLIDVVLSLDFPPTLTTEQLVGEARLHKTNELIVRLFQRQARVESLLIILEDCHWMDSNSWSLARSVSEQVKGLLLVVVTRPLSEPFPRDYPALLSAPTTYKLALTALSPDESLALVMWRLGVNSIPPSMAEFLLQKSQGNPFFLEEIAFALRDTGKLIVAKGDCRLAPGVDFKTLSFPDHVQGVVTSRIDRLAPPEQLALKVASVIGRTFSPHLLRDVCPIEYDKPHLDRHLDTLVNHSLTMREAPEPDPAFTFRHVITQEVAYQMIPPTQRKSLHQAVAEWYEANHHADLAPLYPLLAKHWCNTDQFQKALDYLEKSGENAMRDFAHQEAVTFFSQALELNQRLNLRSDPLRAARWSRQLAEAYYNLSEHGKSLEQFHTTLKMLGYHTGRSGLRTFFGTLWQITKQKLHRLFPSWYVGGVTGERADRRLEASRSYERLTQLYYLNNEKVPAIYVTFSSLNLSEGVGESPELARHYAAGAVFSGLLMMHSAARANAERARDVSRKVDQLDCTIYVEFIRGVYWITVGEWDECEANLREAIRICERIGHKRRWFESAFTLANALTRRGDFRGSAQLSEQILEAALQKNVNQPQIWGITWLMHSLMLIEPKSPKLIGLEKKLDDLLSHTDISQGDQILIHGMLSLSRWRRGAHERVQDSIDAAQRIVTASDQVSHFLLEAYAGLVEVDLGQWRRDRDDPVKVRAIRRRIKKILNVLWAFAMSYPIGRPTRWLLKGHFHWLRGVPRKAYKSWRRSLNWAEFFHMPYEQYQAHRALADHLPDGDPQREVHRLQSIKLLETLGAPAPE